MFGLRGPKRGSPRATGESSSMLRIGSYAHMSKYPQLPATRQPWSRQFLAPLSQQANSTTSLCLFLEGKKKQCRGRCRNNLVTHINCSEPYTKPASDRHRRATTRQMYGQASLDPASIKEPYQKQNEVWQPIQVITGGNKEPSSSPGGALFTIHLAIISDDGPQAHAARSSRPVAMASVCLDRLVFPQSIIMSLR